MHLITISIMHLITISIMHLITISIMHLYSNKLHTQVTHKIQKTSHNYQCYLFQQKMAQQPTKFFLEFPELFFSLRMIWNTS